MEATKFSQWCVVEIMGHVKLAGYVTEESIAGASLLRVDIPKVEKREYDGKFTEIPAFTRYIGPHSIYSLTPVSEDVARMAAIRFAASPVTVVDLQRPMHSQPLLPLSDDRDELEDMFGDSDLDDYEDEDDS